MDLLIKVDRLESDIKLLSKHRMVLNFEKCENVKPIGMDFTYLPEYVIYFECHGYPTCVEDYLKIDHSEIEKIRRDLVEDKAY